jgi:hypothetical protein
MFIIDWLYTNIYGQTLRLDNMNRNKINGDAWTSIILGIFFSGWYPFLRTIFFYMTHKENIDLTETDTYIVILLIVFFSLMIYLFYKKNDRSFKLYLKYQESGKLISRLQGFYLSVFIMLIPYVFWVIALFILK